MANIIKPKRSETPSSVPPASGLDTYEVALNIADKKWYVKDSNGDIVEIAGAGTPGGSSGQLQYNNSGSFAGTAEFTYSSGQISIAPYGVSSGNTSELRFLELAANGSNYVGFKAPNSISTNTIWTLPPSDGINGQFLSTDGSGELEFKEILNFRTKVKNSTGSTLNPKQVIYVNGASGSTPTVALAQANTETGSSKTYALVAETINHDADGFVIAQGLLENIDTSSFAAGNTLWLSPTVAGGLTTTKPSSPNHAVFIGTVINVSVNQGSILINIQNGYELEELHNVSINSETLTDNDIIQYNSSSKVWENVDGSTSNISEGSNLYYTDTRARAALSAGTGISYDNTTGVITNDSPDQVVSLTEGTDISITGTYPNFTIGYSGTSSGVTSIIAGTGISVDVSTGDVTVTNTEPDQIVSLTAGTGISVTGTYPSFTITNSSPSSGGTVTSIATSSPITGGTITSTGTIGINSSSTNTASYVVQRDASGNFSAGTITASLSGNATSATNIAGGGAGQLPYNTGSGATSFLAAGTSGQVLRSNGTSAPSWEVQGLFSGGRLTLETGVPVSTTDQTSKTTIYYTPYNGDKISLYDGTNWATYTFTERSLALGTLTSAKNYDVFIYNNSGTLTLEALAWSTDTARATALVLTNGVYLKSGQTTRRYLGTFRTTSTTTTEDSATKRLVWNFNNRVSKNTYVFETTGAWTYQTAAWRYANNNSNNKFEFVAGLAEDVISAMVTVTTYATTAIVAYYPSAALNTTSGIPTYTSSGQAYTSGSLTWIAQRHSNLSAMPQLGYNYVAWLEYSGGATGTINVSGANEASKMLGVWRC